mmetsp:Transcript_42179/g.101446  ORF Transcript_42179/g.101446 Transcript_42179/m.101446 type:complete len:202 (+) Transcript_42179:1290-1895(+)
MRHLLQMAGHWHRFSGTAPPAGSQAPTLAPFPARSAAESPATSPALCPAQAPPGSSPPPPAQSLLQSPARAPQRGLPEAPPRAPPRAPAGSPARSLARAQAESPPGAPAHCHHPQNHQTGHHHHRLRNCLQQWQQLVSPELDHWVPLQHPLTAAGAVGTAGWAPSRWVAEVRRLRQAPELLRLTLLQTPSPARQASSPPSS